MREIRLLCFVILEEEVLTPDEESNIIKTNY